MAKRKHQRTRGSKKQEGRGIDQERPTERKIKEERGRQKSDIVSRCCNIRKIMTVLRIN